MHIFKKGDPDYHDTLNSNFKEIFGLVYPVGAIYQSTKNTDPSTLFGGKWERINGRTLVGVDENDVSFKTPSQLGGRKEESYTINPNSAQALLAISGSGMGAYSNITEEYTRNMKSTTTMGFAQDGAVKTNLGIGVTGATTKGNNLQPYYVVYMWVRTE